MHILKLSDGQPHEMAADHILNLRMGDVSAFQDCLVSVKLYGPYAGLLVRDEDGYECLTIWNWCTGEQELVSNFLIVYLASYRPLSSSSMAHGSLMKILSLLTLVP